MAKRKESLSPRKGGLTPSKKKPKKASNKVSTVVTDTEDESQLTSSTEQNLESSPDSFRGSENKTAVTVTELLPSLRFEIPAKYKPIVHTGHRDTCKEKLEDDNIELWLCKLPANIDVKELDGQVVNLNGAINIKAKDEGKYKKTRELVLERIERNQDTNPLTVLSLSKIDGQLHPVRKRIQGFLTVRELPVLGQCVLPPCKPKVKKQIPSELKQRYQPFGSDTPVVSSAKLKKKRKKSSHH